MKSSTLDKLRILIVDDSIIYRRILHETVMATGLAVVANALLDGESALEKIRQTDVDIVLLDIFLPDINGIDVLMAIRKIKPDVAVIMISTGGKNSAELVLKSLQNGAMDFIIKPAGDNIQLNMAMLQERLGKLFADILRKRIISIGGNPSIVDKVETRNQRKIFLSGRVPVLIAASTGGPAALEVLLKSLPEGFTNPILIIQHMPPEFTKPLAESLTNKSGRKVVEATQNMLVGEGLICLAPGGWHMTVKGTVSHRLIELNENEYVNGVRPAADVLFDSVADVYASQRIIAIVLTGMGQDGTVGLRRLKQSCMCYSLAQDEETSTIFGMPHSAIEANLINEVLPLKKIGERLVEIVSGKEVII